MIYVDTKTCCCMLDNVKYKVICSNHSILFSIIEKLQIAIQTPIKVIFLIFYWLLL